MFAILSSMPRAEASTHAALPWVPPPSMFWSEGTRLEQLSVVFLPRRQRRVLRDFSAEKREVSALSWKRSRRLRRPIHSFTITKSLKNACREKGVMAKKRRKEENDNCSSGFLPIWFQVFQCWTSSVAAFFGV